MRDFFRQIVYAHKIHKHHPLWYRVAVGTFFFFCGTTFASWAARIPTIKSFFHLNEAELGSVLFLLPLGSLAVLPVAGWAIQRWGSRKVLFTVAINYAIVLFLISLAPSVLALASALFLFGFFGNGLNIAVNTQALQVELKIYRRSLMSSFHALWSLGAMTGALVTGLMIQYDFSIRQHYLIATVIMLTCYALMYFFLVEGDESSQGKATMKWPSRWLWLLGLICFCCALCEGAMADWSSLYYKQVINDVQKVNTTGYTAFALMMALGRLSGDRLIDRFGSKKVLTVDAFFIVFGFLIATLASSPVIVIAGFGAIGMGVSTVIPIVYTLSGKETGRPASVSLASVSSIGFSGFLIGPPLIGYIAHAVGLRFALMSLFIMGVAIFMMSRKISSTVGRSGN